MKSKKEYIKDFEEKLLHFIKGFVTSNKNNCYGLIIIPSLSKDNIFCGEED